MVRLFIVGFVCVCRNRKRAARGERNEIIVERLRNMEYERRNERSPISEMLKLVIAQPWRHVQPATAGWVT